MHPWASGSSNSCAIQAQLYINSVFICITGLPVAEGINVCMDVLSITLPRNKDTARSNPSTCWYWQSLLGKTLLGMSRVSLLPSPLYIWLLAASVAFIAVMCIINSFYSSAQLSLILLHLGMTLYKPTT